MPFDNTAKAAMLNAVAALATRIHLHSGDPGTGNSNVLPGDGAGLAPTWATATAGTLALNSQLDFTGLGASANVLWFSLWNTAGSTRYGKGQITSGDTAANAAGEFSLTTGTTLTLSDA